jgi:hypothetical protein
MPIAAGIRCGCAEDLESNPFWRILGFEPIGKRNGVIPFTRKLSDAKSRPSGSSKRIIDLYRFRLKVPSFVPYRVSGTAQQTVRYTQPGSAVVESSFQLQPTHLKWRFCMSQKLVVENWR